MASRWHPTGTPTSRTARSRAGFSESTLSRARKSWWVKAAEQEHAPAQYNLGGMYSRQLSPSLTREEAEQWLGQAAAQGHKRARRELAELRERPDGWEPGSEIAESEDDGTDSV